jgi:TetR/AcrR family tetracycline transcriptional repressor
MTTSPGLTKQRIVSAALEVLDEAGLEGLTVRAVAGRLSVQAPALYWHVKNKQDLLDEMSTELWREIFDTVGALPDDTPWQRGMTTFAQTTRRTLLSHRDGAKVFSGTYLTDPSLLAQQEEPLQRMIADGFTLENAVKASGLVYSFTIGFCIEEQAMLQAPDDRYSVENRERRFEAVAAPLAAQSSSAIFGDQDARFDELVALIIGAAEGLRA